MAGEPLHQVALESDRHVDQVGPHLLLDWLLTGPELIAGAPVVLPFVILQARVLSIIFVSPMTPNPQVTVSKSPPAEGQPEQVSDRVAELRNQISEQGQALDRHRTATAALLGGGVFLVLLAAGAGYDLVEGKTGAWAAIGLTRQVLTGVAVALGSAGALLVGSGIARQRSRNHPSEARLAQMEEELADLRDQFEPGRDASNE